MTTPAPRFALTPLHRLRPHERIDPKRVERLSEQIRHDATVRNPVVVDEATHVILDGHHRYHALDRLNCKLVPCHLIDYMDPTVRVERWDNGRPMDKKQLLEHGLEGTLLPAKTTRHRTLNELPPHPTPLKELRPEEDAR